jgi:hypothetical protein
VQLTGHSRAGRHWERWTSITGLALIFAGVIAKLDVLGYIGLVILIVGTIVWFSTRRR